MLKVYRGWIFTNDSTEDEAKAKKGKEVLVGSYHDIIVEIDRRAYKELQDEN